jgi:MYXO-CTERM domain-containing protein
MRRSSLSKVIPSFLALGGLAASLLAAHDAAALGRRGISPYPHRPFNGDPAQCGVATYCGGPVLSNVQVVNVAWTSGATSLAQSADSYMKEIVASSFVDMLSEYSTKGTTGAVCGQADDAGTQMFFGPPTAQSTGQTIGRGTTLPAVTITPTNTATSITDDDAVIGQELIAQIAAGHLAAPTYDPHGYPNTLYFVYFPSSYSITLQGGASCQNGGFDGYHMSVQYAGAPGGCTGKYIPYAVMPDCGDQGAGDPDPTTLSHELAEAITDTDDGPLADPNAGDGAWYLGPTNNPGSAMNCGEIGDVCQGVGAGGGQQNIPGTSPAILAQNVWSQANASCIVSDNVGPQPIVAGTNACGAGGTDGGAGNPDSGSPGNDAGTGGSGGSGGSGGTAGSGGSGGSAGSGGTGGSDNNGTGTSTTSSCAMGNASAPTGLAALGGLLALAFARRRPRPRR